MVSFQVAELVAKSMKPHNIVESLIMPACRLMVKQFLEMMPTKIISKCHRQITPFPVDKIIGLNLYFI